MCNKMRIILICMGKPIRRLFATANSTAVTVNAVCYCYCQLHTGLIFFYFQVIDVGMNRDGYYYILGTLVSKHAFQKSGALPLQLCILVHKETPGTRLAFQ